MLPPGKLRLALQKLLGLPLLVPQLPILLAAWPCLQANPSPLLVLATQHAVCADACLAWPARQRERRLGTAYDA